MWGVYVGPSARHRVGAISMFSHSAYHGAPERIAASPPLLATSLVDHIELRLVLALLMR